MKGKSGLSKKVSRRKFNKHLSDTTFEQLCLSLESIGINVDEITSPKRYKHLVFARSYIANRLWVCGTTISYIGLLLNRKYSSVRSILYGHKYLSRSNEYRAFLKSLENNKFYYISDTEIDSRIEELQAMFSRYKQGEDIAMMGAIKNIINKLRES